MRESRTYGSVRGARDETRVPTATPFAVRQFAEAKWRFGSRASFWALRFDVGSSPNTDQTGDAPQWSRRDMSGPMQRCNKPSYSITSSASESSMGDGSIPRERAVLRLRTKASLVGRCTGMSAGFSPRNMRAA